MAGFWTVTIFRGGLWHWSTHITSILGFTSILEHPSKNWLHLREIVAPSQRPPRPQLRRQQCCRSWRRRWSTCQRTSMALFATGSPMISYENWVRSVWFMEISHDLFLAISEKQWFSSSIKCGFPSFSRTTPSFCGFVDGLGMYKLVPPDAPSLVSARSDNES